MGKVSEAPAEAYVCSVQHLYSCHARSIEKIAYLLEGLVVLLVVRHRWRVLRGEVVGKRGDGEGEAGWEQNANRENQRIPRAMPRNS